MPARASKAALDAFIDNQISTLRWSRAEGQRLYSALSRVHGQAVERLLTNQFVRKYVLHPSAADGALTPYARQAIGARVRELESWATKLYAEEWRHTGVRLQRFAGDQARFGLEFLSGAIPTKVDWIMPSVEALRGIVWSSPMSGAVLGQWASKLKANAFRTIETSLVDGLVAGETVRDLTRRVMDASLTRTRREAEAIARTAAIHTSNQSLAALYAENSDVVEGEQWVATLDDRTCPICGPRDGVVYPLGQSVRPPAHFNCRCVMAPALREPFAGTELRAARPEFGGPGPYKNYVDWLKGQPTETVTAHLGEAGAAALAGGSLTSSRRALRMALSLPPKKTLATGIRTIGPKAAVRTEPAARRPAVDRTDVLLRTDVVTRQAEIDRLGVSLVRGYAKHANSVYEFEERLMAATEKARREPARLRQLDRLRKLWLEQREAVLDSVTSDLTAAKVPTALSGTSTKVWLRYWEGDRERIVRASTTSLSKASETKFKKFIAAMGEHGPVAGAVDRAVAAVNDGFEFVRPIAARLNKAGLLRAKNIGVALKVGSRRAFYSYADGSIELPVGGGARAVVHELGHYLEHRSQWVADLAAEFLERRTKGRKATAFGGFYGRGERYKEGGFFDKYVGAIYARKNATEVVAMGLEAFFADPVGFARADREHFDLIVRILRAKR